MGAFQKEVVKAPPVSLGLLLMVQVNPFNYNLVGSGTDIRVFHTTRWISAISE